MEGIYVDVGNYVVKTHIKQRICGFVAWVFMNDTRVGYRKSCLSLVA